MENVGRKLILHKGSKIKSYKMYFKQTVVKFSKKNSIKSATLKFNADHRWEENGWTMLMKYLQKNQLESNLMEVDPSQW